jgi:hypothetical protein
MAAFVPISYAYVPTAPRIRRTARLNPASQQSSNIRSNLNKAEFNMPKETAAYDFGI